MDRRLRLVANNPSVCDDGVRPFVRHLHRVPESDLESRILVARFAELLLSDDSADPVKYLRGRRKFDTSEVVGAILCLSPKAASEMRKELNILAELSLHPSIRHAAIEKMAETELYS
ncbi:MAG: hypothetical protein AB1324_05695 [Candidatus Micrarchaeota archaeon]